MSTCLGLYIEENIIKYAKVSKDHDQIKVESFGIKFYENIEQTIKQIVEETYSYKTPISINLSEEMYNYFEVFALLNKKDFPRAIKTEFESYCSDKNYNPNVFETRYAITPNTQQKEKLKVIHVSENKIELNKSLQRFNAYKLQNITPISMTIPNITEFDKKENSLIVNIEENTIITTIIDQNIYNIAKIDIGMKEILDKINIKENSYQKAYEICKETTIYTSEGRELTETEASYLEDIMPTLYEIVGQIRKIINESLDKIDKIYITGTGALINNIDLYFEEYLEDIRCEILKPSFVKISPEINIKDYVEVNTAISLALSGLGEGIEGMNFKKTALKDKIPELLKIEVGTKKSLVGRKDTSKILTIDFDKPLNKIEKNMIRGMAAVFTVLIVYSGFSIMIEKQLKTKTEEANETINKISQQISLVNNDIRNIQAKKEEYSSKISQLTSNSENTTATVSPKAIPNLLNRLMYVMPSEVQVTSIKTSVNENKIRVKISAQSSSYAQLGYLTASIKASSILYDTVASAAQKQNNIVTIEIEGDLP